MEWTSCPYPECWVPDNFQATPENSSLPSSLDFCFFFFFIKQKHLCSLSLTSPCLASFCPEQCLKCCITSTSCDSLPLYNVSLIVFLNYKSLWIKASTKWLNVNSTWKWPVWKTLNQLKKCFRHLINSNNKNVQNKYRVKAFHYGCGYCLIDNLI